MNYLTAYEEFKTSVLTFGAEILRDDINLPMTQGMVDYYEQEYGVSIGDELFEFYSQMDGLDFRWRASFEDQIYEGYAFIHDFNTLGENNTVNKLYATWYKQEDIDEMKNHHIFETIPGVDCHITIKFDADGQYKLFYVGDDVVNFGGSKNLPEIPLTIEQYFETLKKYYFYWEIRHHLHKPEFYRNPLEFVPELKNLSRLFG